MKKRGILIAALLVLLLTGCDLRNRQPSRDFIPSTHATKASAQTEQKPEPEPTQDKQSAKEFSRHSVRTVLSEIMTFTDIYGKDWTYEFRLPFVDFPSTEASDSNIEIDAVYRRAVDAQIKLSELGQPLTVLKIDYECYYTGALVTLNVWMEKTNGTQERSVYCFRPNGTKASNAEILESVWMDEEEFLTTLREKLEERYKRDNAAQQDSVTYETYLTKTLDASDAVEKLTLYADEEDKIIVRAPLYDALGGVTQIELRIIP